MLEELGVPRKYQVKRSIANTKLIGMHTTSNFPVETKGAVQALILLKQVIVNHIRCIQKRRSKYMKRMIEESRQGIQL